MVKFGVMNHPGKPLEEEIDVVALDGASSILHTPVAVAGDVHDRAEGIQRRVGCHGALARLRAGCGDADPFALSLVRAI